LNRATRRQKRRIRNENRLRRTMIGQEALWIKNANRRGSTTRWKFLQRRHAGTGVWRGRDKYETGKQRVLLEGRVRESLCRNTESRTSGGGVRSRCSGRC